MPAIKGTNAGLSIALKHDQHQVGRTRWTLRGALVAGQIAVSVVLLSAAFLFLRNLVQSATLTPGFDVDRTLWASMRLVPDSYGKPERIVTLAQNALEQVRALPGVESAAVVTVVPLNSQRRMSTGIRVDGRAERIRTAFNDNDVSPDYFKTMGITILAGREFLASDRQGATPVAILNDNMARHLFGKLDPVGHTIRIEGPAMTVVGVARNSKYFTLGEEGTMAMYSPYAQATPSHTEAQILLRAASPASLVKGVTVALLKLDPTAGVETKPMRNALTFAMLPSRVGAVVLGAMGFLGLALASIGLYGVLLFTVSRRIREIGLRMALGATPGNILRSVVGESATLVALGLAIGITLAVLAVRPLAMFLIPEVRPNDPATFIAVAGVFATVALVATLAPAMRALRVDPVVALRHE
jgi:predicted permease